MVSSVTMTIKFHFTSTPVFLFLYSQQSNFENSNRINLITLNLNMQLLHQLLTILAMPSLCSAFGVAVRNLDLGSGKNQTGAY